MHVACLTLAQAIGRAVVLERDSQAVTGRGATRRMARTDSDLAGDNAHAEPRAAGHR
jgi:hypothetical protein